MCWRSTTSACCWGIAAATAWEDRGELQSITDATGERIRRIRGASHDPFLELLPEQEVVREAKDPWVKRLPVVRHRSASSLMVVLFAVFKLTLGSGASDLRDAATEGRGLTR